MGKCCGIWLAVGLATALVQGCSAHCQPPPPTPWDIEIRSIHGARELAREQAVAVTVAARPKWNKTGIQLVEGQEYSITAQGDWCDASTHQGAAGRVDPRFRSVERWRRRKDAKWFELVCAGNSDLKTSFIVGEGAKVPAGESGELTCFANDLGVAYGNNSGGITMTVTRTK